MDKSLKINFLYQSISDTQATIRALDVKIGFLFIVIFIPFVELNDIFNIYMEIKNKSNCYSIITSLTIIFWIASFLSLFSSAVSISDPKKHIKGEKPSGIFFTRDLFNIGFIDNFINLPTSSNLNTDEYAKKIPNNEDDIIKELSFEKMKITYIRDIKIKRSSFCSIMTFCWVSTGGIAWFLFLLE